MDELSTIITMIDNVTNATSAPPDKGDDFDAHVAKMSNIITRPIILIFGTVGRSVFTHLYVKLLGTLKMIILLGSVHYIRQTGACWTCKEVWFLVQKAAFLCANITNVLQIYTPHASYVMGVIVLTSSARLSASRVKNQEGHIRSGNGPPV